MQSVVPAVYPILKESYALDFGQIGLITFANQATASLLQPIVGRFTDSQPKPYSLAIGMTFTLVGLLLLSMAPTFGLVLAAVACVGIGSSIFHPESSRVARMASGGRHGFAQSLLPGRRQRGFGDGTAAGRLRRPAPRPGQHRLVRPHGPRGHRHPGACRRLVPASLALATPPRSRRCRARCPGRHRAALAGHPCRPGLFEERLPGQPHQLLHVLPDPQIRRLGAKRAAAPVRSARSRSGRHLHRRARRRSHRPQVRDLGVDPRRAAVHRRRCPTRTCSGPRC